MSLGRACHPLTRVPRDRGRGGSQVGAAIREGSPSPPRERVWRRDGGTEVLGTQGSPGLSGQAPSRWVHVCSSQLPSLRGCCRRLLSLPHPEMVLRAVWPCPPRMPPLTGQTRTSAPLWSGKTQLLAPPHMVPQPRSPKTPGSGPPPRSGLWPLSSNRRSGFRQTSQGSGIVPSHVKQRAGILEAPLYSDPPSPCSLLPSHQGTPRGPLSPTDLGPVSRGSTLWWSGTLLLTAGQWVQARTGPGWGARAGFRTLLSLQKYASPARRTPARGTRVPSRLCVPSPDSPGGLALCPHPPPPWEARPGRKISQTRCVQGRLCFVFSPSPGILHFWQDCPDNSSLETILIFI